MTDNSNRGSRLRLLRDVVVFQSSGHGGAARHHAHPGVARAAAGLACARQLATAAVVHAVCGSANAATPDRPVGRAGGRERSDWRSPRSCGSIETLSASPVRDPRRCGTPALGRNEARPGWPMASHVLRAQRRRGG